MRKNRKKINVGKRCMALLLILMMAVLAGCADGGTKGGEGQIIPKEGSGKEERPTLTMWSTWRCNEQVSDPGDTAFYKAVEEACNVDLKFIDSSGGKDALSILMGTDDLPDIIYEYDGNMPGGVQKALADDSIIALNELMDGGFLPNLTSYLKSDPEADVMSRNDDGQYAWAPMIRTKDSPLVFNGNMVRQDWLDELELDMPQTVQEMEDVLLAFRDKKGCEAGYSVAYKNYSRMVMSYGVLEGFYVEDDTVKYGFLEDNYQEFLKLFSRWYEMGILDKDAFTQDIDSFYAKIATGKTGMVWGNTGGELGKIETMKSADPDMNFLPAPNPVLTAGEIFPVDVSNYRVNNVGMMISSTCENKEAAARVLDYVYGDKGNMRANYGEEGVSYEMVDGKPVLTELITKNPDGLSIQQALSFYAGSNNKAFLSTKDMMLQTYSLQVQKDSLSIWATPDAPVKQMPPVTMTAAEAEEYNQIMTDITTYTDEFKLKFIMGTEPLDNYAAFMENIEKMDIKRAAEIQQAAYDRYLNR